MTQHPKHDQAIRFVKESMEAMTACPDLTPVDLENALVEFVDKVWRRTGISVHAEFGVDRDNITALSNWGQSKTAQ
jgi:hypothetical protein